jgi:hypothetical protein
LSLRVPPAVATVPVPTAAAIAADTAVAAHVRRQVMAEADALLPAMVGVEAIRRRAVVEPHTVVADRHTVVVAVVAADMGGSTPLDSFPA